jgi:hypothetical protein
MALHHQDASACMSSQYHAAGLRCNQLLTSEISPPQPPPPPPLPPPPQPPPLWKQFQHQSPGIYFFVAWRYLLHDLLIVITTYHAFVILSTASNSVKARLFPWFIHFWRRLVQHEGYYFLGAATKENKPSKDHLFFHSSPYSYGFTTLQAGFVKEKKTLWKGMEYRI